MQSRQTQPLKTTELENLRHSCKKKKSLFPSIYSSCPFITVKGTTTPTTRQYQSWIHNSPSQQNAWCNKIYAFLYLLSESTPIFISEPFDFCEVILKKPAFHFTLWWQIFTLWHKKPKIFPRVLLIKILPSNTADQIASLRFRRKASLPIMIWKQAYKWSKYQQIQLFPLSLEVHPMKLSNCTISRPGMMSFKHLIASHSQVPQPHTNSILLHSTRP